MDEKKIKCPEVTVQLVGKDGNIFGIIGSVSQALRRAKHGAEAEEMQTRIQNEASDYDHALQIVMEYVNVK